MRYNTSLDILNAGPRAIASVTPITRDIAEGLNAASAIGDDRLQRKRFADAVALHAEDVALLRRTLSLQMHEPLRQRIAVQYHLEGLSREELDAYLAQQLKAAGVSQPLFDDTARQGMYQATKGIPRKVNKLAMTALRLAAASKSQTVNQAILLDATAEAML